LRFHRQVQEQQDGLPAVRTRHFGSGFEHEER